MKLYGFFRFFLNPLAKILWPTTVINRENYKNFGGGMIICNHYSSLDGVVIGSRLIRRDMNVLIKKEAFEESKISNWFLRSVGGIPINRGEPDLQAIKAVMNVLKDEKKQLVIFPEGTRNRANDDTLTPLKHGTARFAIKAKRRILPVMYYRRLRPFKRNYMYVGEPIDLSQFYGDKPTPENKERATQFINERMLETRRLCNEAVAEIQAKKNKKKCKK